METPLRYTLAFFCMVSVLFPAIMSLLNGMFASRLGNLGAVPTPKDLLEHNPEAGFPSLSLLIPVRDEELNLIETLPLLRRAIDRSENLKLEVLFLDDGSQDPTRALIEEAGFKVISGKPLPSGWSGKNWACHQLSLEASHDIFLFVDADVRMGRDAIVQTLRRFEAEGLDGLTALPAQQMKGFSEKVVIPWVMHLSICGLLPLFYSDKSKSPHLALGNGQWIAFSREAYAQIGGHAGVRSSLLEDMDLARNMKKCGLRMKPYLAASELEVRMYRNSRQLIEGFSKNFFLLAGKKRRVVFGLALGALVSGLAPFILAFLHFPVLCGVSLATIFVWRCVVGYLFKLELLSDFIFQFGVGHPLGSIAVAGLFLRSYTAHSKGLVSWKGRNNL